MVPALSDFAGPYFQGPALTAASAKRDPISQDSAQLAL